MADTPKLIVLSEQFRGKVFELTKDIHTVGRVEERDICIKDPSISSYHADFIKKGSTYILRDRNSTNGTRVNNEPITEKELKNTDVIQLGGVEMLYDCNDKSGTREVKTMTKIDISSTSNLGTSTLKRLETVSQGKQKSKNITTLVIVILLGLLVLAVIVLLVVLILQLNSAKN